MDDPVTVALVFLTTLLILMLFIGRRKNYKSRPKWRKTLAASLWAANAILFGGVSSPAEKGKITKVRKRDVDDEEPGTSAE